MKSELYLGLDVDKEWIVITVAEWGRNGAVQDLGAISNDLHALKEISHGRVVVADALNSFQSEAVGFIVSAP